MLRLYFTVLLVLLHCVYCVESTKDIKVYYYPVSITIESTLVMTDINKQFKGIHNNKYLPNDFFFQFSYVIWWNQLFLNRPVDSKIFPYVATAYYIFCSCIGINKCKPKKNRLFLDNEWMDWILIYRLISGW